jgi:hypothetical protein
VFDLLVESDTASEGEEDGIEGESGLTAATGASIVFEIVGGILLSTSVPT